MKANVQKFHATGLSIVFWLCAAFLFLTGIGLIVIAKDIGDITFAFLGSLAWGGSVLFLLLGFLHVGPGRVYVARIEK